MQGFAGDGQGAAVAELDSPSGVAVAADGRVFIADSHNHRVRVVTTDEVIHTFAGTGTAGSAGDGGPATAAQLFDPQGLVTAPDGGILIADSGNQRIRSVSGSGIIATVAGSGAEGAAADGMNAGLAAFRSPRCLAVSPFGAPVIGDTLNKAVRVLAAQSLYLPAAFVPTRVSSVQPIWAGAQTYGQAGGSVGVSGAVGVPQGSVDVVDGGSRIASATLTAGVAGMSAPALGAGVHNLTIAYSGDGLNPAASVNSVVDVSPATVVATADSISVPFGAPLPALTGQLTGVLAQDAGQVSVAFSVAGPGPTIVGTYGISASLQGPKSANYVLTLSPTSGALRVVQAASKVALGSIAQGYAGLPLRLSATVLSTTTGQPTGTVQFLDGASVVGTAPVVNGSASAVYLSAPAGSLSLTARYLGDANFAASTSPVETASVSAIPDFLLSTPASSSATVAAGGAATFAVQVQAQPGPFTGVVAFSATGLPAGAVASFSPTQVVPGAGAANVTMTVQTPVPQALLRTNVVYTGRTLRGCWRFPGGTGQQTAQTLYLVLRRYFMALWLWCADRNRRHAIPRFAELFADGYGDFDEFTRQCGHAFHAAQVSRPAIGSPGRSGLAAAKSSTEATFQHLQGLSSKLLD